LIAYLVGVDGFPDGGQQRWLHEFKNQAPLFVSHLVEHNRHGQNKGVRHAGVDVDRIGVRYRKELLGNDRHLLPVFQNPIIECKHVVCHIAVAIAGANAESGHDKAKARSDLGRMGSLKVDIELGKQRKRFSLDKNELGFRDRRSVFSASKERAPAS